MSKRKIKVPLTMASEKIDSQIQKGKELAKTGSDLIKSNYRLRRGARDRDNYKSLYEQWVDFTYEILKEIFYSNSYAVDFKKKKSSKVEYVNSSWKPDVKYYLEKQIIPKLDFLEILKKNLFEFEEIDINMELASPVMEDNSDIHKGIFEDKNGTKQLSLRDRIENSLFMVIGSLMLIAYITGIGTYKGILEIANLDTIQEGSYIKKEQYENLKNKYEELKSDAQKLNGFRSEIDIEQVGQNEVLRLPQPIKVFWKNKSNLVIQVYNKGQLVFNEEHSSPYIIRYLHPNTIQIKFWIPGEEVPFKTLSVEIID